MKALFHVLHTFSLPSMASAFSHVFYNREGNRLVDISDVTKVIEVSMSEGRPGLPQPIWCPNLLLPLYLLNVLTGEGKKTAQSVLHTFSLRN